MFSLPNLAFKFDALEPYIDAKTMEIHYNLHHGGYVKNLNDALSGLPDFSGKSIEEVLKNTDSIPTEMREKIINNGGGHANHSFFWTVLTPNAVKEPIGQSQTLIETTFASFERFKEEFSNAAMNRFGSGWAWLLLREGKLAIESTPNQNSPLMDNGVPILGLDVWEHAYYLSYQNKRAEYIKAFWNIINWPQVEEYLAKSSSS